MKKNLPKLKALIPFAILASTLSMHTAAHAAPDENPAATKLDSSAILGIKPYQIFQRDAGKRSTIHIKVGKPSSHRDPNTLVHFPHYVISLIENGKRASVVIDGDYTGQEMLSFSLPTSSKFEQIRVSFYDAGWIERQRWDSAPFNVGEVFLVAGQSNAANEGSNEGQRYTANPLHRAGNPTDRMWYELTDPMPYATTNGPNSASPWPRFADHLSAELKPVRGVTGNETPVALVNVAQGSTAVEEWQSTSPSKFFERLKQGALMLKRFAADGSEQCDFRAVLWHQGESNALGGVVKPKPNAPAPLDVISAADRISYADGLTRLAKDFAVQTGCKQPWFVANASWLSKAKYVENSVSAPEKVRRESEIRLAQRYLVNRLPSDPSGPVFKMGPDTDLLAGEATGFGEPGYRLAADGAHFAARGLALHGQLWATYVANMIDPSNHPLTWNNTVLLTDDATYVWQQYEQLLGRQPAEMEFDKEGFRYWVQHAITKTVDPYGKTGRDDVATDFSSSNEKKIRDTYQRVLQRRPTWWELLYWLDEMKAGRVTESNMASQDHIGFETKFDAYGKKAFLLYVKVMGRNLQQILQDKDGLPNLTRALSTGQITEATATANFLASAEYRVRKAFIKTRGRQPTWPELLDYHKQVSDAPVSDAALEEKIWRFSAY